MARHTRSLGTRPLRSRGSQAVAGHAEPLPTRPIALCIASFTVSRSRRPEAESGVKVTTNVLALSLVKV